MGQTMGSNLNVEQVEDEAAAWILKLESPDCSPADEVAFKAWLAASTNHRVAYARLRGVWREAGRLKIVGAAAARGEAPARDAIWETPFFARKKRPVIAAESTADSDRNLDAPRGTAVKPWRWAASGLMVVAVAMGAYLSSGGVPSYRTPVGGLATVPMQDGSRITLNTDSEITLQMTAQERRVNLMRGEAFFEVAKDPHRPFVVYADDQRVVAVGTKFVVRLKPEAVQVAVTEGLVRMEKRALATPSDKRTSLPLLTPGTIVSARDKQVSIEQKPIESIERALSWRTGYVVLQQTLLSDAVAEFNRYNRRQLVIEDAALGAIVVGGNFRSDNLDGFVRLLQDGFPIQAQEDDRRIILTRK